MREHRPDGRAEREVVGDLRRLGEGADPREAPPDDAEVERRDPEAGERRPRHWPPPRQHRGDGDRPAEREREVDGHRGRRERDGRRSRGRSSDPAASVPSASERRVNSAHVVDGTPLTTAATRPATRPSERRCGCVEFGTSARRLPHSPRAAPTPGYAAPSETSADSSATVVRTAAASPSRVARSWMSPSSPTVSRATGTLVALEGRTVALT